MTETHNEMDDSGTVRRVPGRYAPTRITAIVGKFPEGPLTVVAGGSLEHLETVRQSAQEWILVHPLGEFEELRIFEDVPLEPPATSDSGLQDTVGELRAWLAHFPADTPITGSYTGTGRISAIGSYWDDSLMCVSIHAISPEWLTAKGLPTTNPALKIGL